MSELMNRVQAEHASVDATQFQLDLQLDLTHTLALISNLQLALRHPANTGPTARMVRTAIDGMIERIQYAGLPANAELARLGDDPAYDV